MSACVGRSDVTRRKGARPIRGPVRDKPCRPTLRPRLGDVETDRRNRLHAELLRIVGASNSTHIFGTYVPVEEPSTASEPDSCTATGVSLFDHLVGEDVKLRRDGQAERIGGLAVNHQVELGRLLDR
jgi:hypothetical protein